MESPETASNQQEAEQLAKQQDTGDGQLEPKDTVGAIVDKTVEQIKNEADALAGKAEDDVKDKVEGAEQKVRHAGHDVLDELEQHRT